jgi:hypothetical protein
VVIAAKAQIKTGKIVFENNFMAPIFQSMTDVYKRCSTRLAGQKKDPRRKAGGQQINYSDLVE